MDLFDVLRITARRWYISVPVLIAGLAFAFVAFSNVSLTYTTTVPVGIVAPSVRNNTAIPTAEDPGVSVTNGLQQAGGTQLLANLLALRLESDSIRANVAAAGGSSDYAVAVFDLPNSGQLPIVNITAVGSSAAEVNRTATSAAAQADPAIKDLQTSASVPTDQAVSAFQISPVQDPVASAPGRSRKTAIIAIAALAEAVVAAIVLDGLLGLRKGQNGRRKVKLSAPKAAAALRESRSRTPVEPTSEPLVTMNGSTPHRDSVESRG